MISIRKIILITRPWAFILSIIRVSFSFSLAYYIYGTFNVQFFLLTLLGVILLHASMNVLNDYFDYKKGLDTESSGTVKYRLHPIVHGVLTPRGTMLYGLVLGVLGLLIAVYLALFRILAIIFGLIGFFIVYAYHGPPFSLKYKGLGEILDFIANSLNVVASFYIASDKISIISLFDSLPIASIATAVLVADNMRDADTDKLNGIKTLATLFPRRINEIYLFLSVVFPYSLIPILILLGYLPTLDILTLLTLPLSVRIARYVTANLLPDSGRQSSRVITLFGTAYVLLTLLGSF